MKVKHPLLRACLHKTLIVTFTVIELWMPCADSGLAAEPLSEEIRKKVEQPWTGDFDLKGKRRYIRALVTFNKTNYFLDGAQQKGGTYELLKMFEEFINKKSGTGNENKLHIVFIPVRRDQLISALAEGRGDIAAANLTVTSQRLKVVDFSDPLIQDVKEVVVTSANGPTIKSLEDLSGKKIFVRKSSSFYESLLRLNNKLKQQGKPEIQIQFADENLETEDLLEMVKAGVIPATIADSHMAEFWVEVFTKIKVHSDIAVNEGGKIAWALRKNTPKLRQLANEFIKDHRKGTLLGNILYKRYLKNNTWVKNPLTSQERKKLMDTLPYFKKFGEQYKLDWILVAAQGYQESGLDQNVRSSAGAIGVMQVKPSTAADKRVNIPNIEKVENNIHAGVKYLRVIIDSYFKEEDIDLINQGLFAIASYNAGPTRIAKLRKHAASLGFNPNLWFQNVEVVAAREIGRETVTYVSNIFKYYLAYQIILEKSEQKKRAKEKFIAIKD